MARRKDRLARLLSDARAAFLAVLASKGRRAQMSAYAWGHDAFVAAERLLGAPLPWITEHPKPAAMSGQARRALRTIEELQRRLR